MYKVFSGEVLKKTCASIEEAQVEASKLVADGFKDVVIVVPE